MITASSAQKLDMFSQNQSGSAKQQEKSQSVLERTVSAVDSASKTALGEKLLSNIFG